MHEEPRYIRLDPGGSPPADPPLSPYRAVVVVESQVSPEWRAKISRWLVDTGCLYMMAWGEGCSAWHDSVDIVNLEDFDFGDIPDEKFVMTTWHNDDLLSEVIWFAKTTAHHPDVEVGHSIILHIADNDRETELLQVWQEA